MTRLDPGRPPLAPGPTLDELARDPALAAGLPPALARDLLARRAGDDQRRGAHELGHQPGQEQGRQPGINRHAVRHGDLGRYLHGDLRGDLGRGVEP